MGNLGAFLARHSAAGCYMSTSASLRARKGRGNIEGEAALSQWDMPFPRQQCVGTTKRLYSATVDRGGKLALSLPAAHQKTKKKHDKAARKAAELIVRVGNLMPALRIALISISAVARYDLHAAHTPPCLHYHNVTMGTRRHGYAPPILADLVDGKWDGVLHVLRPKWCCSCIAHGGSVHGWCQIVTAAKHGVHGPMQ